MEVGWRGSDKGVHILRESWYRRRHWKYNAEIEQSPRNWAGVGPSSQIKAQETSCPQEWWEGEGRYHIRKVMPLRKREVDQEEKQKRNVLFSSENYIHKWDLSYFSCLPPFLIEAGCWECLHHPWCPLGHGEPHLIWNESVTPYWEGSFPMH